MSRKGKLCCTLPHEGITMATDSDLFLERNSMDYNSRTHWSWYYMVGTGADHETDHTIALEGACENDKHELCMSSYACA